MYSYYSSIYSETIAKIKTEYQNKCEKLNQTYELIK